MLNKLNNNILIDKNDNDNTSTYKSNSIRVELSFVLRDDLIYYINDEGRLRLYIPNTIE